MKLSVVCLVLVIGSVAAEPPRFIRRFQPQFQRQEVAPPPQDQEQTTPQPEAPYPPAQAPYPPSGWKPAGRAFNLPARQQQDPNQIYGPPPNEYGPPTNEYGPPSTASTTSTTTTTTTTTTTPPPETTTEPADDTTTTANPDSEDVQADSRKQRLRQRRPLQNRGAYYVLLPDSRLQKVQYRTENDLRNMAYTARLQYKDVEPINGPVYVVSPQYVFPSY